MPIKKTITPYAWFKQLAPSKKVLLISFLLWLFQAIPKWIFVIMGDGEATGDFLRMFITPRGDL